MPTARKLPSGSWHCKVTSHYERTLQKDGTIKKKRIYKSFTCDDPSPRGKRLCEKAALEWLFDHEQEVDCDNEADFTVKQALSSYIEIKSNVLSPSTVSTYINATKHFKPIESIRLRDLNNRTVQKWVNDLSADFSPKTVSNTYGLLTAALYTFMPDKTLHVKLPQKQIYQGYVPTDTDIKCLIDYAASYDQNMLIAIYLAAFGTLRRSEICGLTADDVNWKTNTIHVHSAVVMNKDKIYVKKNKTKTRASDRYIEMPDFVIKILPKKGPLVPYDPRSVTKRFLHIMKVCDVPKFRFHDLRHYSASIMHALGIPDVYIMQRGGWSSDHTLKQIYRGSISDYERRFTLIALDHYEEIVSEEVGNEMGNENKKAL